jgi:hypothetical protein
VLLRKFSGVVLFVLASTSAHAAEKTFSINFVGDWCFDNVEGKTTTYILPSGTEGGQCKKILSINPVWIFR